MSSVVYDHEGRGKSVKNLGWFFKKARTTTIESFHMVRDALRAIRHRHDQDSWEMTVAFDDGLVFKSDFADLSVFKDVMNRQRSLQGVVVEIDDNGKQSQITLGRRR